MEKLKKLIGIWYSIISRYTTDFPKYKVYEFNSLIPFNESLHFEKEGPGMDRQPFPVERVFLKGNEWINEWILKSGRVKSPKMKSAILVCKKITDYLAEE